MKYCHYCGGVLADDATVCLRCGTPVTDPEADVGLTGGAQPLGAETPEPVYPQPAPYPVNDVTGGFTQPAPYPQQVFPQAGYGQPAYPETVTRGDVMPAPAYGQPVPYGQQLTFDQFKAQVGTNAIESGFKSLGIICLISAALCLILAFVMNPYAALDAAICLILGLVIVAGKKRSKGILIFLLVYLALSAIINVAMGGAPGGIFALITAIVTLSKVSKLEKAYKNYQATGVMPTESF
jgi:hypothetical protein